MDLFSIIFLIFLFATLLLFYLCNLVNNLFKKRIVPQWSILLLASLFFYGFSNYFYLIYLSISFVVSYAASILMQYKLFQRVEKKIIFEPQKIDFASKRVVYERIFLIISIVINVGILAVLKYFNFFTNSVNSLFHLGLVERNFIVPLGISFYTFSLVAYNVDCYKRVTNSELNPLKFLLFVSYFPKILQGPISSYNNLTEAGLFEEHHFKDINFLNAFFRISIGLIKKIAIANVFNLYVNSVYSNLTYSFGINLVLTAFLYSLQLYFDFSGFMDIAIGTSELFGIKLEENFDTPYLSTSFQDFWRRWHITLGAWLKKYIYIPLGGNRVSSFRWAINTLIVWLISGLWHGANWTFVVWGLFHGIMLIITGLPKIIKRKNGQLLQKKDTKIRACFLIFLTFSLVTFGWIFFRAPNIKDAARFIWHMVKIWVPSSFNPFDVEVRLNIMFIISFAFIIVLIFVWLFKKHNDKFTHSFMFICKYKYLFKFALMTIFVVAAIFEFYFLKTLGGAESSFIYFDF